MGGESTVLAVLLILASLANDGECIKKKKEAPLLKWDCLKARYRLGNEEGHYPIPLTVGEITDNEYTLYKPHEEFGKISLYCVGDDPTMCPMYHRDHIIGIRMSYVKSRIRSKSNAALPYTFDDKKIFKSGEMFKQDVYYVDVFFQDVEVALKNDTPATNEPVGDGVYLNMDGNGWKKVPRKEEDIKKTDYTKQACFPGMGMHYFYKMTKDLKCEDFQPPFFLFHRGQMVGFALVPFGRIDALPDKRVWFEDPPGEVMRFITPKGPKCVADWIGKHGGMALHFWFIPEPQKLCPFGFVKGLIKSFTP